MCIRDSLMAPPWVTRLDGQMEPDSAIAMVPMMATLLGCCSERMWEPRRVSLTVRLMVPSWVTRLDSQMELHSATAMVPMTATLSGCCSVHCSDLPTEPTTEVMSAIPMATMMDTLWAMRLDCPSE